MDTRNLLTPPQDVEPCSHGNKYVRPRMHAHELEVVYTLVSRDTIVSELICLNRVLSYEAHSQMAAEAR
jgi:hypothetical protein